MNETKKIYLVDLQDVEGKYSKKRYFELSYTITSVQLINLGNKRLHISTPLSFMSILNTFLNIHLMTSVLEKCKCNIHNIFSKKVFYFRKQY